MSACQCKLESRTTCVFQQLVYATLLIVYHRTGLPRGLACLARGEVHYATYSTYTRVMAAPPGTVYGSRDVGYALLVMDRRRQMNAKKSRRAQRAVIACDRAMGVLPDIVMLDYLTLLFT